VVASELLVRYTVARQLGTALLVIVLGGVAANLGLLPTGATEQNPVPVYEAVFGVVAPLSIFWLLLTVRLRDVFKAGKTVLIAFGVGAVGTVLGALVGIEAASAVASFGEARGPLVGMFAGTYIGGSVNFNAVALEYDVVRRGGLYAGAVAVDNIITAVWMVACLTVPKLFSKEFRASREAQGDPASDEDVLSEIQDRATVTPFDLAIAAGLGVFCVWLSGVVHDLMAGQGLWAPPDMLILTVFALVLAQTPWMERLQSPGVLGMFAVYLFLTVIGAHCDVAALRDIGGLAGAIAALAGCTVAIHGIFAFGVTRILRIDGVTAAVASQANIGGGTTALALARSLGRRELVLPAILLGALGNAVGNFAGFTLAELLR
jgi:uncharacterized membrane protein